MDVLSLKMFSTYYWLGLGLVYGWAWAGLWLGLGWSMAGLGLVLGWVWARISLVAVVSGGQIQSLSLCGGIPYLTNQAYAS